MGQPRPRSRDRSSRYVFFLRYLSQLVRVDDRCDATNATKGTVSRGPCSLALSKGSKQKLMIDDPPPPGLARRSTSTLFSRPRSCCSQASTSPSPRPPILTTTTPHKITSRHPHLNLSLTRPRPLTCDQDLDTRYSRTSRIVSRRQLLYKELSTPLFRRTSY